MEPTHSPTFPSPADLHNRLTPTFPVAETSGSPGCGAENQSGILTAEVYPVGGFAVLQGDEIHVLEREVLESPRPLVSMPSPTTSSATAVSPIQSPALEDATNVVFPPLPPHFEPATNIATPRRVEESLPFFSRRKLWQDKIHAKQEPYAVPALNTTDFPHLSCPPQDDQVDPVQHGWVRCMHPDGNLYFYSSVRNVRIFTESYLYDSGKYLETLRLVKYIADIMRVLPRGKINARYVDLVVNVDMGDDYDEIVYSYYFIDHQARMPFWLRPYNPSVAMRTTELLGVTSPDHLRHLLHAAYWEHCALFPCDGRSARAFTKDAHAQLVANLTWCAGVSVVTPTRYTAPWTAEEAMKLREQIDYLRQISEYPAHYIEVAGRTMSQLERWRYDFLHGTQVIRRFRGQTVLPERDRTLLYKTLLPVLFYAPLAHLYDCESVYLDGVFAEDPEWTRHVKKLLSEWQEFVLYATILLNANLAFLSVPNTILFPDDDTGSGNSSSAFEHALVSPTAIISYCSMLTSIGSIVIGLLLIRQHRGEEIIDNPRTGKGSFLEKRKYKKSGFELVSIQYSLPYALLMWSIIMFLSALIIFTQLGTDRYTRGTALAMLAVIVVFSIWCIQLGWGTSQNRAFFAKVKDPWAPTALERVTTHAKAGLKAVHTLPRSVFGRNASLASTKTEISQQDELQKGKEETV